MYDYATVTQQLKILQELQTLNSNFVSYNETLIYLIILVSFILIVFLVRKFIIRCLGK